MFCFIRAAAARSAAGVPATLANQQPLQQMTWSAAALAEAPAVLLQLLSRQGKKILAHDRRHRDNDPLLRRRRVDAPAAPGNAGALSHRPQARAHRAPA